MSCDNSVLAGLSVLPQWSKLMWKPSRCFGRVAAILETSSRGVTPSASAPEHDRRAVRVVGADKVHDRGWLHALEAHPDVGLDVLHDVPDVKRPVGVGQGSSDK